MPKSSSSTTNVLATVVSVMVGNIISTVVGRLAESVLSLSTAIIGKVKI
ncbi:hypothetical protein O9992_01080 [Vibrio lentus]|nr:hypothetical protein [Vibrio lentus]